MSPRVRFFISRMIVVAILTIPAYTDIAYAQGDSCRCRLDPPFIGDSSISVVFPDTVEIDGCGLEIDSCSRELLALSPDQLVARLYVRGPWLLRLPDSALVISEAPYDTMIYRSWSDIDSSFSDLRDSLASLESRFGSLSLRKAFPEQGTGEWSREFAIQFDSFVPLQTVDSCVQLLPGVERVHAAAFPTYLSWSPNDPGLRPGLDYYAIGDPEPIERRGTNDTIFYGADLHRTGWEWQLYRQKAMLAWELTRGKNAVGEPTILGIPDEWGTQVEHPDFNDDVNDPDHNYTPATGTTRGDGASIGVELGVGHGLGVSSMAVAKADNGVGMVGVCPECVVVGFSNGLRLELALGIDGDGIADQNRRHPQVLSCSWWEPWQWSFRLPQVDILSQSGVIVIASANNNGQHNGTFAGGDHVSYPNSVVLTPVPSDPLSDVKVIAVGASRDGDLVDYSCTPTGHWRAYAQNYSLARGAERPVQTFNYPKEGVTADDKWNLTSDPTERRLVKRSAFIDILAGTGWCLEAGSPSNERLWKASVGTSQAAPQVNGTCGLMLSVNPYLGTSLDESGKPEDGYDVQRRAYNILTFTADKIVDDGEGVDVPDDPDPDYYQPDADHDPLRRTWARRVGYGRLNIYRAVAHAIPAKGNYEYTTSTLIDDDLATASSSVAQHLIHFGAHRDNWTMVMEGGGIPLPDGNQLHLNQGLTLINGSGVTLTIDDDVTAAFDGIIRCDNSAHNAAVVTEEDGKALFNGYVQDVSLSGNLFLADVGFEGNAASSCVVSTGSSWGRVESYESIRLHENAEIDVNNGRWIMRPGCTITMDGSKGIRVRNGGVLEMEFGTEIIADGVQEIHVEGGGTLIVNKMAKALIDAKVVVSGDGQVILDSASIVDLDAFAVDSDAGLFEMREKTWLSLQRPTTNTCLGTFRSLGESGLLSTITGPTENCCARICTTVVDAAKIVVQSPVIPSQTTRLQLEYTNVSNVPIVSDNAVSAYADNCVFSASRDLIESRYLLTIDAAQRPASSPLFVSAAEASVTWCEFKDEEGQLPGSIETRTYPLGGLYIRNQRVAAIENSDFRFFRYGIATRDCGNVSLISNEISECNVGVYDAGSTVSECGTVTTGVEYGSVRSQSAVGIAKTNEWRGAKVAFVAFNSAAQHFRGNSFTSFKIALHSTQTLFNLAPLDTMMYGRNLFDAGIVVPPNEYPTSYWSSAPPVDIRLSGAASTAILECGWNNLSTSTKWHLFAADGLSRTIYVGSNRWNGPSGYAVRASASISTPGSPLNVSQSPPLYCTDLEETEECEQHPGEPGPPCGGEAYYNVGKWTELDSSSAFLDSAFTYVKAAVKDTSLEDDCRRMRLRDLLVLGRWRNLAEESIDTVITTVTTIAVDTNESRELRVAARMTLGSACTMISRPDSAIDHYDAALGLADTWSDSVQAIWGSMEATAAIDSSFGSSYDSIMAVFHDRVLEDLRSDPVDTVAPRRVIPGPGNRLPVAPEIMLTGVRVEPNPANETLRIHYRLGAAARVRIELVAVDGELVDLLGESSDGTGAHVYLASVRNVPSGVYACRVSANGVSETLMVRVR